jgi:uncharacterized protein YbjT (DUF2867 family)
MAIYFVTGATGKQGGAVAHALLSFGHQVHAIVRNPSSEASKALEAAGATLFTGTYSSLPALQEAAKSCTGVFLNTMPTPSSWDTKLIEAKNIITASLSSGVKSIIYSSVLKTGQHETFPTWDPKFPMAGYWISKDAIEKAVRGAGFETWAILRPGYFMSNLLVPTSFYMYPELPEKGIFKSAYGFQTKLALVDPWDIGKVAAKVFQESEKWNGREIDVADKEVSVKDTVGILEAVSGKAIKIEDLGTGEEVPDFRKRIAESQRWLKVLDEAGIGSPDLTSLGEIGVKMRGLKDFLEEKKEEGILGQSIGLL